MSIRFETDPPNLVRSGGEETSPSEADMSDTPKKRRRWPWMILVGVLLLVGAPIAWRFRPLNATERTLVGHWKGADSVTTFELSANRRFHWESVDKPFVDGVSATHRSQPLLFHMVDSRLLTMEGDWSATRSSLSFQDDVDTDNFVFLSWLNRLRAYAVAPFSSTAEVHWHGPDRFDLCGQEFVRVLRDER